MCHIVPALMPCLAKFSQCLHLFDQNCYIIVSLSSILTFLRLSQTRRLSLPQFSFLAMWDNNYQICFLKFFLLLTSNFEAVLCSDIHKTDLALNFNGDGCDPPWISCGSSDSCYLRGSETMMRFEGVDFCNDHGGYLVEVNSEKEHLDLIGRLNKN